MERIEIKQTNKHAHTQVAGQKRDGERERDRKKERERERGRERLKRDRRGVTIWMASLTI